MKFGTLFAYWTQEWHGDYVMFSKKVKGLGFDILEISAGDLLTMSEKQIAEFKAVTKDLGIEVTSNIGPPKSMDVASKDASVRDAGVRFLTDIMKVMDKLDSRVIAGVMYTYWPYEYDDLDKEGVWARGVQSVKKLGRVSDDLGIDFCLEVVNRFETLVLNTCEEALQYCDDVGEKSVKILLDTFHMNIEEDDMAAAIRLAGDKLGHLHVGEGNRKPPGQGALPWNEIGQALRDINFEKGVVMEPFVKMGGQVGKDIKLWRDLSGGADAAQMDRQIKASLEFLKKAFVGE